MAEDKATILHVDDDEANRYAVTRSLVKAGFLVTEAADGNDALRKVSLKPDLVILDIRLPDIDGFEICRRIKSDPATAEIPVLHLSASFISSEDKAHGLNGGADGYLVRPVEPVELIATVNALLRARRSEQRLSESEAANQRQSRVFDTTLSSITDFAYIFDRDGRFLYANKPLLDLWGLTLEQAVGKNFFDLKYPPELAAKLQRQIQQVIDTREPLSDETPYTSPTGAPGYYEYIFSPVFAADGGVEVVAGSTRVITERKRVEEELRTQSERLRAALAASDTGTFRWNPYTSQFYEFDDSLKGLFGFAPEEPVTTTQDMAAHVHRDDVPALLKAVDCCKDGSDFEMEFRVALPDQRLRWLFGRAKMMRDTAGRPQYLVGACTDITARKEVEEGLRRAAEERETLLASEQAARVEAERAGRMKDDFLATLSHELRTPLNSILGWSTILRNGAESEEDLKQGLETIERNARAQTQIIEDLLDMSRIISGKVRLDVQHLDLAAVVQAAVETAKPAADAKGVRVQTVLDPQTSGVSGDPNRLQQVLWNLLSNAIKFTPRGGRVQVVLQRVDSHLEISVTDSGEGIDAKFLPHVFDRFRQADASTTRRHGGLGLGLAIVKQLVELHGGTIRARSPGVGQGSTFTVTLPLSAVKRQPEPHVDRRPGQEHAAPIITPDLCVQIAGVKVLVVDDEPDSRELVKRLLEDCEAIVTTAGSASEAVERVQADLPDVLVSDIGMPGEDGYSLIRRVRALGAARGGAVPAVALTAYARAEDRMRSVVAGYQMHIAKPVEPAELITMVASLAGRTSKLL